MQFRDLHAQYNHIKNSIDSNIQSTIASSSFIGGSFVSDLEEELAQYVGVTHCITCANGTDALQLALMAWNIGPGDAVLVPDFTFFSSGEVVSALGATPIFVDVDPKTYNISAESLLNMINKIQTDATLTPRVIVAVDLFGQPAEYKAIRDIADQYGLYILEDAAQGFGGNISGQIACSFGDISTTSFFPAKPLGCYGDGGAIFTDNDEWAEIIQSLKVHGKGSNKYDNIRIGMNSRLDTIQAGILLAKFPIFRDEEIERTQQIASIYTDLLQDSVLTPVVLPDYLSSWAQYTIQCKSKEQRDSLQQHLKDKGIPSMVYYQKPMHRQLAFNSYPYEDSDYLTTNQLCNIVLSLPFHPYMSEDDIHMVANEVKAFLKIKKF